MQNEQKPGLQTSFQRAVADALKDGPKTVEGIFAATRMQRSRVEWTLGTLRRRDLVELKPGRNKAEHVYKLSAKGRREVESLNRNKNPLAL